MAGIQRRKNQRPKGKWFIKAKIVLSGTKLKWGKERGKDMVAQQKTRARTTIEVLFKHNNTSACTYVFSLALLLEKVMELICH